MNICSFSEEVEFKLKNKRKIFCWLLRVIQQEHYRLVQLNFIFCSDSYLYIKNRDYLGHDTLTDVLTFDYSTREKNILGDIYISIERVKENAQRYNHGMAQELHLVMVHGLLHLLGYNDQTVQERRIMQEKETFYCKQLVEIFA